MGSMALFSRFVRNGKSEAVREQLVLLHAPENLKPLRSHSLETAEPRHGPLHPEVITLDPLLQVSACCARVPQRDARMLRESASQYG